MALIKRNDEGLTVQEIYEAMKDLIERGHGNAVVYERRHDEPMRYIELHVPNSFDQNTTVMIMEAY